MLINCLSALHKKQILSASELMRSCDRQRHKLHIFWMQKDAAFPSTQQGLKSLDGECKSASCLPPEDGGGLSGRDIRARSAAWSLLTQLCVTSLLNSKVVLKVDFTDSSFFCLLEASKFNYLPSFLLFLSLFWWNLAQ